MKTILGSGQLGLAIMRSLLEKDPSQKILVVNRKGKLDITVPSNVEVVAADVTDPSQMEAIAGRSEIIFSCTDVPYHQWKTFYPATAGALAHALRNTKAKLVFADNMYSYGNVMGKELNEQMPHTATTKKGITRAGVINTLLYSGEAFNNRVAFVKAADFIGPGIHKGIFGNDFLNRMYEGRTVMMFGDISALHSFTYIKDFATAMINVGTAADAFGQIWHVPNSSALSIDKWMHLFEVIAGKKIRKKRVPTLVIKLAGIFNPLIKELYEMAYQFEQPLVVNHDKYVARFGNHAAYPSAIVKETIACYHSTKKSH